ncbi:HET-domain-containing protein [Nemania serpens]|nr:HET-domain-containing protein [Nemania serpens]
MDTDPRSPVVLAPHFEFLPIDSSRGQIRVLRIAPGKVGDVIKCSYEIVDVDDDVSYQTLSYVWGAMDENRTAIVEGTRAELTDNLFAALTRIRHETETQRLWIDALCINQEDAAEKMAQVNMMHRIYSNCEECNIWMGDIDYAAIGAAEPEALEAAKGALDAIRIMAGEAFETLPPHLATEDQQAQAGKALKALMNTTWWERIWTVQEATSPRNAIVHWGPLAIPWGVMKKAAQELIEGNYPSNIYHLLEFGGSYGFFTAPILGLKWASEWVVDPDPPLEMLYRFRYRDSTDPRDKVYVILNLVAEGTYPLPSVTSSDYAINTAVLYRNVMLDLLRGEQGLRAMIGLRGERKSVPGLPSWVVDWSLPPPGLWISKFWEHSNFWWNFTADRGLPMLDLDELTSAEYGEDVLNLNGVFFDKILAHSDLIAEDDDDDRLYEMVDSLTKKALADESRDRNKFEVYWRESLAGIIEGDHTSPEETFEGQTADAYWREQMFQNQRLFIAENGAVGLGPSGTSVGDEIWVLAGGRTPFLLSPLLASDGDGRKDRDASWHYTFRGDVFVPKIMRGKAVSGNEDRQRFVHIH